MTFSIQTLAHKAKLAAFELASLNSDTKNNVLLTLANLLRANTDSIIEANSLDVRAAKHTELSEAMVDRLLLTEDRIESIAKAVEHIASLPDPVGLVTKTEVRPNGLRVTKQRIPLGVIAMVYESRPNVTIDAAALCFKSGNAAILRGGKEALHTNQQLANLIQLAFAKYGIDGSSVSLVPTPDREVMTEMLTLKESIDLVIPRGGEGLIKFVTENSQIPVIQHFKGVCHLYVDQYADLSKAIAILDNGKTQRPGVCNALETLLVHESRADTFLPMVGELFTQKKVQVHACQRSLKYFEHADLATDLDYDAEYLALEIAVKVVTDIDEAIDHIHRFSSGHTEVIVSQDISETNKFIRTINSSVVMINASSRFSDGGELGLGAEIGISTSKLHAYGPMGLESLTTEKFVVFGDGQTRD